MMQKQNILHLLLGAALLTGCSTDMEQGPNAGGIPIDLGYNVVTATDQTGSGTEQTRAATNLNNDQLTSGNVAVSVKKSNVGTYTTAYNYTAAATGVLSPATANQFFYETDGSSSDIIAYYPATAAGSETPNLTSAVTFSVQTSQTEDENYQASDLMWAQQLYRFPAYGKVTLPFTHKLTKIIVNASAGTGVSSITSVTLNNVKPKVDFTASDGTVTLASSDNAATNITMSNEGAALIPPQTIDGSFITIVTNAGTAVYAVENKEFESGHQYTLNITVNAAAVGITNTITNWNSEGTVNVQPTVEVEVTKNQYPFGLPGLFSISSTEKVCFSQGNLQYQASTSTWRFAEHQYDYVGNGTNGNVSGSTNASISSSYSGWIDLFGWGTSGYQFASGYGTAYQPWSTSTTNSYGPTDSTSGLTVTYANGDWGSNAISNGGNSAGLWRTLTKDEWLYLFGMTSNNSDASGHARYRKYFRATVNSVQGIVVLPDDISGISDIPAVSSRGTASTYGGKTYTTAAWSALESAGAVFLPAAGGRNGTTVNNAGSNGYYWSSTASGAGNACYVYFRSNVVSPADINSRPGGFSVRLVRVAP